MTRSLDAWEDGDGKMVMSCKHTHQHQFSVFFGPHLPKYPISAAAAPVKLLITLAPRYLPACSLIMLTSNQIAPGLTLVQVTDLTHLEVRVRKVCYF